MKLICAWCQPVVVEGELVSHGICDPCAFRLRLEFDDGLRDAVREEMRECLSLFPSAPVCAG